VLEREIVLDSSALLAWYLREAGAETVAANLSGARMSAVNLSEVVTRLAGLGVGDGPQRRLARQLNLLVVPFGESQAYRAAQLRAPTREAGLSFGDRACLALASEIQGVVLTADRQWAQVDVGVEVRLIR
jgi:PIN domain nuclease of toxin-antitoxin system